MCISVTQNQSGIDSFIPAPQGCKSLLLLCHTTSIRPNCELGGVLDVAWKSTRVPANLLYRLTSFTLEGIFLWH